MSRGRRPADDHTGVKLFRLDGEWCVAQQDAGPIEEGQFGVIECQYNADDPSEANESIAGAAPSIRPITPPGAHPRSLTTTTTTTVLSPARAHLKYNRAQILDANREHTSSQTPTDAIAEREAQDRLVSEQTAAVMDSSPSFVDVQATNFGTYPNGPTPGLQVTPSLAEQLGIVPQHHSQEPSPNESMNPWFPLTSGGSIPTSASISADLQPSFVNASMASDTAVGHSNPLRQYVLNCPTCAAPFVITPTDVLLNLVATALPAHHLPEPCLNIENTAHASDDHDGIAQNIASQSYHGLPAIQSYSGPPPTDMPPFVPRESSQGGPLFDPISSVIAPQQHQLPFIANASGCDIPQLPADLQLLMDAIIQVPLSPDSSSQTASNTHDGATIHTGEVAHGHLYGDTQQPILRTNAAAHSIPPNLSNSPDLYDPFRLHWDDADMPTAVSDLDLSAFGSPMDYE